MIRGTNHKGSSQVNDEDDASFEQRSLSVSMESNHHPKQMQKHKDEG